MTNSPRVKQEMIDSSPEEHVLDLRKSSKEKSCTWCGKKDIQDKGVHKDFCSDVCFDQYRRDNFKKRSACIWCSSSAVQQNVILSATNVDESKFCSPQCLAQFKVRVFCEETSAHLDQLKELNLTEGINDLITPDSWLKKSPSKRFQSPSGASGDILSSVPSGSQPNGNIVAALTRPIPSLSVSSCNNSGSPRTSGNSGLPTSTTLFSASNALSPALSPSIGPPPRKRGRSSAPSTVSRYREKEGRAVARRGGGNGSSRVPSSRIMPAVSPFPGMTSSLLNNTFQLPGFPLTPHLQNGRFPSENNKMVMNTRADKGVNTAPTSPTISGNGNHMNSSALSSTIITHHGSQSSSSPNPLNNLPSESRRSNPSESKLMQVLSAYSNPLASLSPVTMVVPIPLPIPIPVPIPIPIILNLSNNRMSMDSRKNETPSSQGEMNRSSPNKNTPNNNNVDTTKNSNGSSLDISCGNTRDKLKRQRHIIDIEEND